MSRPHLKDSSILVVEDEPLIALDISMAFEKAGAHLTTTNTEKHAKLLVGHDGLSAAILDHALRDGDSTSLRSRISWGCVRVVVFDDRAVVAVPD